MDKFNEYFYNTLNIISKNLTNIKSPIADHNSYFNNNWNKYNNEIIILFTSMFNILDKIFVDMNQIDLKKNQKNITRWTNINHDLPFCYLLNKKKQDTNTSKQYNKILFKEFNEMYNKRKIKLRNNDYTNIIKKYSNNLNHKIIQLLNYFQTGSFVSLDVKLYTENNINIYEHYNFNHLELHFFYNENINVIEKKNIINKIYIITKWIHSLNNKYKIKLIYFDTPLTKIINKSDNFLSSQNVNSGSSSSNIFIMIWRREEFTKVLIHELIHYLDLDVKYDDSFNNIINYQLGNLNFPVIINETITEIQAQLLHTIFISFIKGKTFNKSFDYFKTLYNYELIYSLYQFSKIMNFYSIKEFNEKNLTEKFNQTSNVFSYYILKSILTLNFGDILFELNHMKQFDKNNKLICDVNQCLVLSKYIKKQLKHIPIELLNKIIRELKLNDNSLKMTICNIF